MRSGRKRGALVDPDFDYERSYTDYDYSDEEFDQVDEESRKKALEFVEGKYSRFVQANAGTLSDIEYAISTTLSDVWSLDRVYIGLRSEPYEQATLLELLKTENKVLGKILAAMGSLCLEARLLRAEASTDVFASIALFGAELTGDEDRDDGDLQIQMGRLLPLLQSMCVFVRRCYAVVINFVHQLASLYSASQRFFNCANIHFRDVWAALGDVLAVLLTVEEIVTSNTALSDGWQSYRRMIDIMRSDPAQYDCDTHELDELTRLLIDIEHTLFDSMIFDNAIRQTFDFEDHFVVATNGTLRGEFEWALAAIHTYLSGRLLSPTETSERTELVGLCALFVLYHTVYPDAAAPALGKALWDLHATLPVVHLYGAVALFPADFLLARLPDKMVRYGARASDAKASRLSFLKTLISDLPAVTHGLYLQVSTWMVRMESNLVRTAPLSDLIDSRAALFLRGVVLASAVSNLYHTTMAVYTNLRKALTPSRIRALCQLVELLKCIEQTYARRTMVVAETVTAITQQMTLSLERMFLPAKADLEASRLSNNASLDALAGVNLVLAMLSGPPSEQRRLGLRLGLSVAVQKPILRAESFAAVDSQLRRIDLLSSLQSSVRAACSTEFFYWSRVLLPHYFAGALERPTEVFRLQYMFAALQDAAALLAKVERFNGNVTVAAYRDEVLLFYESSFVKPLCTEVEVELRLLCHGDLLVHRTTPFDAPKRDLSPFFRAKPIAFLGGTMSIADRVGLYLDAAFYNITAVSLQDWSAYEEMRNLAAKKWGLALVESHLQGHSQQARLDVLVIMRNIAAFVSRYDYNLNSQLFIERVSSSKALNIIDTDHIAASIRTHGPGVLNTAVNYVYQFIKGKFVAFATFLFDDHIRSRLAKDIAFYAKNHDACEQVYPYDRAEAFNREIRNLGTADGLSYLDRFRLLVTEIGNAMGFIRMLRSGGLHALAGEIQFVPNLQRILALQDLAVEAGLSRETTDAARLLDQHLAAMSRNFAEGSEFFPLLTSVFSREYQSADNDFLRAFHIIVPPLTINFVEAMLESKERLIKKSKDGATFTDDGFAMGLAFIMEMLGVSAEFKALHWFDAVSKRLAEQEAKVADEGAKKRSKLERETAQLTLNKMLIFRREFQLLNYTYSGAAIFFKSSR